MYLLILYVCYMICFQMLEEPHFSTPPSSPPPSMHVLGYEKQHNFKVSSVSWCTDYMEVMGCEKPHNFKVSLYLNDEQLMACVASVVSPCMILPSSSPIPWSKLLLIEHFSNLSGNYLNSFPKSHKCITYKGSKIKVRDNWYTNPHWIKHTCINHTNPHQAYMHSQTK